MKQYLKLSICILSVFIWSHCFRLYAEEVNPWNLSISERIINRKNVSHIIIDPRENEYRLVLLVSDRFPYNYKQVSFPFYFRLRNEQESIMLMKKISDYLETGQNITIHLEGSVITKVIFHKPYHEIP